MTNITRVRGTYQGRNAGSALGGFGWGVATAESDIMDMFVQTEIALQRLDIVLAKLGTDKTRLLTATIYITDMTLKDEMERAWCAWIGPKSDHWPQRACVQAGLAGTHMVEITVMAAL